MTLNEEINPLKIFVGWDSREDIAYQVCKQSILDHASVPVEVIPLKQKILRKQGTYWRDVDKLASTEFTFTRFLIPELMGFNGWALFIDCDFVFLDDIKNLFDQVNDTYAVMCAHHDYTPKEGTKMDGQQQTIYPRKNWSSMMLINCGHVSNKKLNRELVNNSRVTGAYLHRFSWLNDSEIGQISHEWNWLVGWYKQSVNGEPKALHYTEGGPWFKEYKDCEYASEWYNAERHYLYTQLEDKKKE
jgi:lipopolysaccharide biosynthesis glycosyltransferase